MAEIKDASVKIADPSSQERRFLDHVRRIANSRAGRFAVHLHLSRLRPQFRQPHHIRIAERSFDFIVNNADAQLYVLANADMVLMCKDVRVADVDAAIYKLRALFKGDPVVGTQDDTDDLSAFSSWYDLENDYDLFLEVAEGLVERAQHTAAEAVAVPTTGPRAPARPLDPRSLDALVVEVQNVPMAKLIGQQPAVRVGAGGQGDLVFREHYVSIRDLQKAVAPGVDILSDIWLFQYLTEVLDRRVLTTLGKNKFGSGPAVSINLNISTVLAPEFAAFDRQVGDQAGKVIIEIQKVDAFADMRTYIEARHRLQTRGYRILIDALNPLSLGFFDPSLFAADFYKITWNPEEASTLSPGRRKELRELIATMGRHKAVLARVDSEDAVRFGLELGITCFQGHFVDRLIAAIAAKAGMGKR